MDIIDAHSHISNSEYGNIELLKKQHDQLGIKKGILVPGGMLDVRIMTRYITGEMVVKDVKPNNHTIEKIIQEYSGRYYGFYCVDPSKGEKAVEAFREAIKRGFSGLKLSPLSFQFSLTSRTCKALAKTCGELGVVFYTHVLFNPAASTRKIGLLAREFPNTNFVIGHLGFGPADIDAFELARKYDNVFLETSTANVLAIAEAYRIAGASKLIFGSEFPLSHPKVEMTKISTLALAESEEELIYNKNIMNLLMEKKGSNNYGIKEEAIMV